MNRIEKSAEFPGCKKFKNKNSFCCFVKIQAPGSDEQEILCCGLTLTSTSILLENWSVDILLESREDLSNRILLALLVMWNFKIKKIRPPCILIVPRWSYPCNAEFFSTISSLSHDYHIFGNINLLFKCRVGIVLCKSLFQFIFRYLKLDMLSTLT